MKVVGRRYASVSELVRDTADSKFARDFEQHRAERGLVNSLASLRGSQGLTQKALAERGGPTSP